MREAAPPPRLADGSHPLTPAELLERLESMGIEAATLTHEPVFTVEQAQILKGHLPGAHTKNLFVRDKKGTMWLLVALHDRPVDLRALGSAIGARGRLSFGSARRLMEFLGVRPGSVTPFAVVNDHGGAVSVLLDRGLDAYPIWNAHPLDNGMTTSVRGEDLIRFLGAVDHPPRWVDLEAV